MDALRLAGAVIRHEQVVPLVQLNPVFGVDSDSIALPLADKVGENLAAAEEHIPTPNLVCIIHARDHGHAVTACRIYPGAIRELIRALKRDSITYVTVGIAIEAQRLPILSVRPRGLA